ncbi:hypothetical protein C8Q74DRAFT_958374 [Fomes fomentarius]|nr:hypothetical protein C8Q74DRAFT_958374 [Fomes fomentarius]
MHVVRRLPHDSHSIDSLTDAGCASRQILSCGVHCAIDVSSDTTHLHVSRLPARGFYRVTYGRVPGFEFAREPILPCIYKPGRTGRTQKRNCARRLSPSPTALLFLVCHVRHSQPEPAMTRLHFPADRILNSPVINTATEEVIYEVKSKAITGSGDIRLRTAIHDVKKNEVVAVWERTHNIERGEDWITYHSTTSDGILSDWLPQLGNNCSSRPTRSSTHGAEIKRASSFCRARPSSRGRSTQAGLRSNRASAPA